MEKGDIYYYAQIMESIPLFEVIELKIRTVRDTYLVGVDKRTKHVYTFTYKDINKSIFEDRDEALRLVQGAEKKCKKVQGEKYYEEY